MGTRSAIGIIQSITHNGTVRGIYCHWDGYIEHNGQILNRFYKTTDAVNALIDQGDLSALGAEIGTKHDFSAKSEYIETDLTTSVAKECTFYGRDRGEVDVGAKEFKTMDEFTEFFVGCGCDYLYLFDEWQGTWMVCQDDVTFKPLNGAIADLEILRKIEANA